MSVDRRTAVALAVGALLGALALVPAPLADHAAAPPLVPVTVAAGGACPGAYAPANLSGRIVVEGGAASATATVGRTIVIHYFVIEEPQNAAPPIECVPENVTTTVGPGGAFAVSAAPPPNGCGSGPNATCALYTGPFGPFSAVLGGGPPAGYVIGAAVVGDVLTVALVDDLTAAVLSPAGPTITVAPTAPTPFAVTGAMGNGSASPLPLTYTWRLSGSGWSFTGAHTTATVTVAAVPGAGVGTLAVAVNASVAGATFAPTPASVTLVATPTAIETAQVAPTSGDVGTEFALDLLAVGPVGYAYVATVDPGLAQPPIDAPCSTAPDGPGVEAIACATNMSYPAPGVAQPSAVVTNGFSSATWTFPDVTVEPAPSLSVVPGAPVGYAGRPMSVEVSVANGTGVAPYARACLSFAGSGPDCSTGPGPVWSFAPVVSAPGTYPAVAWVVDADGTNRSVGFSMTAFAPLTVGPVSLGGASPSVGASSTASVNVTGGDLPARFWWNASDAAGPLLAGTLTGDGPIALAFVPPAAGDVVLTCTVRDGLGGVADSTRVVTVAPAPATVVAPSSGPPAAPVVAGSPFTVSWTAVDAGGIPVPTFSAAGIVAFQMAGAPVAGVNVSGAGLGALPALGNGTFSFPSAAWRSGSLALSITCRSAGTVSVALAGLGVPGAVPTVAVTVVPDRDHLRLTDPVPAAASGRSAATRYTVTDRFGNPAPGAVVTVRLDFGGAVAASLDVVTAAAGGSGVWVNYTAPGSGAGTVQVVDAAGEQLVPTVAVGAVAPPPPLNAPTVTFATAVPIGVTGAVLAEVVGRRQRRAARAAEADEAELQALAEGRARVVELVRAAGALDLRGLEAAWSPPPAPAALADWVASLVADGTLGADVGDDGQARFRVTVGAEPVPRVTVDAEVLEQALRDRAAAIADDER